MVWPNSAMTFKMELENDPPSAPPSVGASSMLRRDRSMTGLKPGTR